MLIQSQIMRTRALRQAIPTISYSMDSQHFLHFSEQDSYMVLEEKGRDNTAKDLYSVGINLSTLCLKDVKKSGVCSLLEE